MSETAVSVIVVSYGGAELLRRCLDSIPQTVSSRRVETIVVDNASPDGTADVVAEEYAHVVLVRNPENVGFAAGNNVGIRIAQGRFVMLLNPDAELLPGSLDGCAAYLDAHCGVSVVAPRVVNPDGSLQFSLRNFPTAANAVFEALLLHRAFPAATPRYAEMIVAPVFYEREREIQWASGAAFMTRAETFERVGLLDERYFLYSEETDWFYRASRAGLAAVYLPHATVLHRASSGRDPRLMRYAVESRLLYARLHLSAAAALVVRLALGIGLGARLLAWGPLSLTGSARAQSRSAAYRVGVSAALGLGRQEREAHA